jgi:hypothetical protein
MFSVSMARIRMAQRYAAHLALQGPLNPPALAASVTYDLMGMILSGEARFIHDGPDAGRFEMTALGKRMARKLGHSPMDRPQAEIIGMDGRRLN